MNYASCSWIKISVYLGNGTKINSNKPISSNPVVQT